MPALVIPLDGGGFSVAAADTGEYPTVEEISARLVEMGLTPPSDATILAMRNAAVTAWENATGYHPFLNADATVTTRRFSPRRKALLDIGGIVAAPTSVTIGQSFDSNGAATGGTALVVNRDYAPQPGNALEIARPYTHLRYTQGGPYGWGVLWGGNDQAQLSTAVGDFGSLPLSVAVAAPFGFCTEVPADVWEAIMRCVLSLQLPASLMTSTGGLKGWKEETAQEDYPTAKDSPFLSVTDYFEKYESKILAFYKKRRIV